MRTALHIALEGTAILALALLSVALGCVLRFLRSRHPADTPNSGLHEFSFLAKTQSRRPVFLSREGICS